MYLIQYINVCKYNIVIIFTWVVAVDTIKQITQKIEIRNKLMSQNRSIRRLNAKSK